MLEALYRADVRGLLDDAGCRATAARLDRVETYRGTTVKMELSEKVRFEIGVSDHFVEPTVRRDHRGRADGRGRRREDLRRSPVEQVVRIRTGEVDTAAVTPVSLTPMPA